MKNRESQERQHKERDKTGRPSNIYYNLTSKNLDVSSIPDGMHYLWATKQSRGESMANNISNLVNMGYRPVPKSRHPELCFGDDIIQDITKKEASSFIEDRDAILMEIPKEEYNKIQEFYKDKIKAQSDFAASHEHRRMFGMTVDHKVSGNTFGL